MSFITDSFTGTDGTALDTYNSNWVQHSSSATQLELLSNAVVASNSQEMFYYRSEVPPGPNYSVEADLALIGSSANPKVAVIGRVSTSVKQFYWAGYDRGVGAFQLCKYDGGWSQLGTDATDSTVNHIKLEMIGTTISLYKNGESSPVISVTDSSITSAGQVGIWTSQNGSQYFSIDNFDASVPLVSQAMVSLGGVISGGVSVLFGHNIAHSIASTGGAIAGGSAITASHAIIFRSIIGSLGAIVGGLSVISSHNIGHSIVSIGGAISGGKSVFASSIPSSDLTNPSLLDIFNAAIASITNQTTAATTADIGSSTTTINGQTVSLSSPEIAAAINAIAQDILAAPSYASLNSTGIEGTDVISSFIFPTQPDQTLPTFTAVAPSDPSITFPDAPTIVLPDVPTFDSLSLPTPDDFTLPIFSATPDTVDLALPSSSFSFSETIFDSATLDAIRTKLATDILGGDGIDSTVESGIWTREASRAATLLSDALGLFEGFALDIPSDSTTALEADITLHATNNTATAGRLKDTTHAELEQKNRQSSRESVIALESATMTYYSQIANRNLQVAILTADLAKLAYEAVVAKYSSEVIGYRSLAEAFSARVRAELTKIEAFRAEVEAMKITNTLNRTQVEVYKAQIQGINEVIAIFRTQVDAAKIATEVQIMRAEIFRARIDAYSAQVQAIVAVARMKEAIIKGEMAKVEVYRTQVEEYRARIKEIANLIEIRILTLRTQIESYQTALTEYSSQVAARRSDVSAQESISSAQNNMKSAQEEVTASSLEQKARLDSANLGAVDNQMIKLRNDVDQFIQKAGLILRQIEATGTINVQQIRAAESTLAEVMTAQISRFNTAHSTSYRDLYDKIDLAERVSEASLEFTLGLDLGRLANDKVDGF